MRQLKERKKFWETDFTAHLDLKHIKFRRVKYLQGVPLVQGSPLVPEVLEAPAVGKQTVSAALCYNETDQHNSNRFKGLKNFMWTYYYFQSNLRKHIQVIRYRKWCKIIVVSHCSTGHYCEPLEWWNAKTKLWAQCLHYPAIEESSECGVIKILWMFSNDTVVF